MGALARRLPAALAGPRPWWETRWMVALAIAAATMPLLYPDIPPLVDLLGIWAGTG